MALYSSVTPPLPVPRHFHLGRFLPSLVVYRWLVQVLDPVFMFRIVILFRITGKSSAFRRETFSGDGLPTPKRWKRLVPQGTGSMRIEDSLPSFLFPRIGELVRHQGSVAAGSGL